MNDLRIIGGKARGRKIKSVPGEKTRPITDKVREALFNIIGPDIADATMLDLFAGTGSVGIEALSRGAHLVVFIEKNWQALNVIRENLRSTGLGDGAKIIRSDAFAYIDKLSGFFFDYIYIAPPQYKGMWKQALQKIDKRVELLSDDAWVIVQIHPVEYEAVNAIQIQNLVEFDQRHYGSTLLIFYHRPDDPSG